MAHDEIIHLRCFSNLSPSKILIPSELLYNLSQLNLSSLLQNSLCKYGDSSLLVDNELSNLDHQSNEINFPNKYEVLGNNHFDEDESADIYDDEYPSASTDLSIYQEDIVDLDLKYVSVK